MQLLAVDCHLLLLVEEVSLFAGVGLLLGGAMLVPGLAADEILHLLLLLLLLLPDVLQDGSVAVPDRPHLGHSALVLPSAHFPHVLPGVHRV